MKNCINKSKTLKDKEAIARGLAVKSVIFGKESICTVAKRYGVHRTTLWRWIKRWYKINSGIKTVNYGRPSRTKNIRAEDFCWKIPAKSSAPHTHPQRLSEDVVCRILKVRDEHKRCAEVISYELSLEGIKVSSSTVKRVLNRTHRLNKWSKWKKKRPHTERPLADHPGARRGRYGTLCGSVNQKTQIYYDGHRPLLKAKLCQMRRKDCAGPSS